MPAAMNDVTVWVLTRGDDASLRVLDEAGAGVRYVTGAARADFSGAPAPDAILVCSMGRAAIEPVLALAPGVRWIHSRAAGLDSVLFPALVESDVPLTNGRGVFSASLAEFAIASLLYFARDFPRLLRNQRRARWEAFEPLDLAGRTLGVVGYGDIGRAVAERAHRLGMRVVALRRRPALSRADAWVEETLAADQLLTLMRRADDVVVATPLTEATRGLVGEDAICAMRLGAVFVNLGRGPVVDEAALARALAAGRLRGAALDVFETEPLPAASPLWALDNVLVSPHCADNTPGWLEAAMRAFLANLERFRRGERLLNVVDKRLGY
jgi:phosphoglycerate dehydrogenase-like enzyme